MGEVEEAIWGRWSLEGAMTGLAALWQVARGVKRVTVCYLGQGTWWLGLWMAEGSWNCCKGWRRKGSR
jgi:hypothetical protein